MVRLIGIAPLFMTDNRDGEPALMLLGSIEISDYLDVIARPEDLPAFLEALLEHLASEGTSAITPAWICTTFWKTHPPCQPYRPQLKNQAGRIQQEPLQHCPYIPLPGDWEKYICGIDKKQRHEIRRKMRRAEEYYLPLRWYITQDGAILEQDIDGFLDLMACDPDKAKFLTPAMRDQMHSIVKAAASGRLAAAGFH